MPNYKGLLGTDNVEQGSSSTTASGGLTIPKALYGQLIDAVRNNLVWAPLAAISLGPNDIPGSSVDIDLESESNPGIDMVQVAEGAEFPTMALSLETINVKPVKYAVRLPITVEMLEDGKWNLLERAVNVAGYKAAKKIDSLIIDQIDSNAGNTTSGGASITVANILAARKNLKDNQYAPTDFVVGTEVESDLLQIDIFVQADKSGVTNPSRNLLGRIYGMNVWVSDNQTSTSSYVIDRNEAFYTAMKRALTIKNFDEVWKDIRNAVASMRYKAGVLRSNAIAKITTS